MYFNTEYLMLDSLTEYKTHLYYVILAVVVFFILLIWNVTVGFSESEKPPSLSIWGIAWIVLSKNARIPHLQTSLGKLRWG